MLVVGTLMHTRRDFAKIALSTVAAAPLASLRGAARINSTVAGVKLGAISYCFRAMPRPAAGDYIDTIVKACVECGVGYVELTSPMVEPASTLPGGGRVPPRHAGEPENARRPSAVASHGPA